MKKRPAPEGHEGSFVFTEIQYAQPGDIYLNGYAEGVPYVYLEHSLRLAMAKRARGEPTTLARVISHDTEQVETFWEATEGSGIYLRDMTIWVYRPEFIIEEIPI